MFSLFVGMRYTGSQRRSELVSFISLISTAGLIVSVCLLVTVFAVMNGFDKELRERVLSMVEQVSVRHQSGIEEWQALRADLMRHPEVVAAAPFVEIDGVAYRHKQSVPIKLVGVDPELEATVSAIQQYLSPQLLQALNAQNNAVVLGSELADKLGAEKGDRLRLVVPGSAEFGLWKALSTHPLEVIDTFKTGTVIDNSLAITSLGNAQQLTSTPGRVTGVKLKLRDIFDAPYVAWSVVQDLPYGYRSYDWTTQYGSRYQDIQLSKKIVSIILFLIVAIAVFNLVSTLVMIVVDKQSDIAILRTLGASTRKIMAIFMVQGSFIGVIGTLVGVVLGLILATYVTDITAWLESIFDVQFLKSDVYPTSFLPSDIRAGNVIFVALVSLSLSFVATVYPAWRASRVKPAEALRFEL